MEPIDYTRDVLSPMQGYMQGLQFGEGIVSARQARDEAKQAMGLRMAEESRAAEAFSMQKAAAEKAKADAERGQAELARLAGLGAGATDQDFLRTWIANPAIRDDLTSLQTTMSAPKIATMTTTAQNLYAAASQGNAEAVRGLLSEQLAAAENTGDQTMIPMLRASLDQLDADPQAAMGALRSSTGLTLMGLKGPEYLKQMNEVLGVGAPKPIEAASPLGKIAQDVNAGLIPQSVLDSAIMVDKQAAEGGLNPKDKAAQEQQIRGEWTKLSTNISEARRNQNLIETSANDDSGAGDIALVTAFSKMLDPMTGVRDTEFANARDSGGLYSKLIALTEQVQNGKFLSPEQRESYKRLSAQYLKAAEDQIAPVRSSYDLLIKNYGLNPENIYVTGNAPSAQEAADLDTATPAAIPQLFLTNDGVIAAANNAGVTPEQMWAIMSPEMRAQYGR